MISVYSSYLLNCTFNSYCTTLDLKTGKIGNQNTSHQRKIYYIASATKDIKRATSYKLFRRKSFRTYILY